MSNPELFKKNKYVVVKNALSKDAANIGGMSLLIGEAFGHMMEDTAQVVGASCCYSYPVMEAIMLQLHKVIEENTGLRLCPTYSFARVYRAGDVLERHTDRPSCEISATVTLSYKSDKLWPICVQSVEGKDTEVPLEIGDLMIYRGCEVEHWRDAFDGELWMQVFVHFVDMDGPYYPEYAFDQHRVNEPQTKHGPSLYKFIMKHML